MAISEAITRTLQRIGLVSQLLTGLTIRILYAGIAQEFERVKDYIDLVKCATVPSSNLCTEALDDLESKFGISYLGDVTDQERINRIIERASLFGAGGPRWVQDRVQEAGFPLYVIENVPRVGIETQYGTDLEYDQTTQYAMMPKRIDPITVPGITITSSPNKRGARRVAPSSQYGTAQYGEPQYSTPDLTYSYPQPAERQLPTNPTKWGRVFFLSPFPDRLATESELLLMGDEEIAYLKKLVIQIKFLRNWCVAQVATRVVRITDDGAVRVLDDGTTERRA